MPKTAKATDASEPIPLNLAPLLAPYKKYRRLSLRVERLPDRARLSQGRNNGDRSWSLTRDDLEDLFYLPPTGMDPAHTLAIRIINLDSDDGATLAVLDLPILPGSIPFPSRRVAEAAENAGGDAELGRVRNALADAEAALQIRDRELAEAQKEIERVRTSELKQAVEAALTAGRLAWTKEQDEVTQARIEEACEQEWQKARAALSQAEESWKKNETARLADERKQWQELSAREIDAQLAKANADAAAKFQSARVAWQAEQNARLARSEKDAQERLEQARQNWREETEAALLTAENNWKIAETERLVTAEARLREQFVRDLDEARQNASAASVSRDKIETELAEARAGWETELRKRLADAAKSADANFAQAQEAWKIAEAERLAATEARMREQFARDLTAAQQKSKSARVSRDEIEAELAKARAAWDAESRKRLAEAAKAADTNLAKAEKRWKASEAERLALAEAQIREQFARDLAIAQEKARSALEARDNIEAELARAHAAWESELQERLSQASQTADANLSKAQDGWKAAEATRLAATETRLRAQFARDLAKAQQKSAPAPAAGATSEERLDAARKDWESELQKRLEQTALEYDAQREAERAVWQKEQDERLKEWTEQAELRVVQAKDAARRETDSALSEAKKIWEAGEAGRLAAAESRWRKKSARALVEATERLEQTEAALARLQAEIEAQSAATGDTPPSSENAIESPALPESPSEQATTRAEIRKARERWKIDAQVALKKAEEAWRADEAVRIEVAKREWERQSTAAKTDLLPLNPDESPVETKPSRNLLREALVAATVAIMVVFLYPRLEPLIAQRFWPAATAPALPVARISPSAPKSAPSTRLITIHSAKLRSGPSTNAQIMATLSRGTLITEMRRTDKWIKVHADSDHGRPSREGWVYETSLKIAPPH